ncbi:uncharacterized protein LACBIDRAFT_303967 [Laccaria bicolor S238N-H82]|uniref:Predicted protein n=1 Tax=Laccaria bicolor (strain S238N-H82 / ATCC MYA-4686) TaxID=486041 RepID=B0DKM8_LACBS|nr:uncharacterized protein LACBIDRAFT_303967 [Laccaria bicolor S238N-H82]EDR04770.1 predicted protein [Laccaria bicolor S238N-H82]|eukprot:XP_001884594.1 predicted protein [Laccaria bicolor S238N-H82]
MTINKSQGQSVNYVGIDAQSAVFTHGIIWDDQLPIPVTKNIVYPEVLLD